MSTTRHSGFALFPKPPTPPGNSHGRSMSRYQTVADDPIGHNLAAALLELDDLDVFQCNDPSPPLPAHPHSDLRPAPLQIRKSHSYKHRRQRSSATLPQTISSTSSSPEKSLPTRFSRFGAAEISQTFTFRSPPLRTAQREILGHRKGASGRLSQWLDVEQGLIDRGRLSRFLGNVLDASFTVPYLPHLSNGQYVIPEFSARESAIPYLFDDQVHEFHRLSAGIPSRPCTSVRCECPPGTVLCQWISSSEYKSLGLWRSRHQKSDLSISSTTCMLQVPRGRFRTIELEHGIAEDDDCDHNTPPGLSHDSSTSSGSDWSSPLSPHDDGDIFTSPPDAWLNLSPALPTALRGGLRESQVVIPPRRNRIISFSRPFRTESTLRHFLSHTATSPTENRAERNVTPTSEMSEMSSPDMHSHKQNYLGSVSTLSTFDFDFEYSPSRSNSPQKRKTRHELPACPEESTSTTMKCSDMVRTGSPPPRYGGPDPFHRLTYHQQQHSISSIESDNSVCEVSEPAMARLANVKVTPHKPTLVLNQRANTPPQSFPDTDFWRRIKGQPQRHEPHSPRPQQTKFAEQLLQLNDQSPTDGQESQYQAVSTHQPVHTNVHVSANLPAKGVCSRAISQSMQKGLDCFVNSCDRAGSVSPTRHPSQKNLQNSSNHHPPNPSSQTASVGPSPQVPHKLQRVSGDLQGFTKSYDRLASSSPSPRYTQNIPRSAVHSYGVTRDTNLATQSNQSASQSPTVLRNRSGNTNTAASPASRNLNVPLDPYDRAASTSPVSMSALSVPNYVPNRAASTSPLSRGKKGSREDARHQNTPRFSWETDSVNLCENTIARPKRAELERGDQPAVPAFTLQELDEKTIIQPPTTSWRAWAHC